MPMRQGADSRGMAHVITAPNETAELAKLLTTPQAAQRLGVSKRTIQELASDRKLAFIKFGRNVRFSVADLDKFVESHRSLPVGWKGGAAQ